MDAYDECEPLIKEAQYRDKYLKQLIRIIERYKNKPVMTAYLVGPTGHGKSSIIDTLITALDPQLEFVYWKAPVAPASNAKEQTTMSTTQYTLCARVPNSDEMVEILHLVDTRGWSDSPETLYAMIKETVGIVGGGVTGPVKRLFLLLFVCCFLKLALLTLLLFFLHREGDAATIAPNVVFNDEKPSFFNVVLLVVSLDTDKDTLENLKNSLHWAANLQLRYILTKKDSADKDDEGKAKATLVRTILRPPVGRFIAIRDYCPPPDGCEVKTPV